MKKYLLAISALVLFAACQRDPYPAEDPSTPQVNVMSSSFMSPDEFAQSIDIQTTVIGMAEVPSVVEAIKTISISSYNEKLNKTMQEESGLKSPSWGYHSFVLRYKSVDGAGKPIFLSEKVVFPEAEDFRHSISQIHLCNPFTNTLAAFAPSMVDEYAFAISAAQDAIVVCPDGQGLGESSGRDLLFTSLKLQARQNLDGLLAALEFLKHQHIELAQEHRLVNWGYSLGAGTALAIHRIYEGLDKDTQEYIGAIQSICGSGPYNIPRTVKWLESQEKISYPICIPLAVCGLKESQPELLGAYPTESFFSPAFNNSGIMDMIRSRRYGTQYLLSAIQARVGSSWKAITSEDMQDRESEQHMAVMQAVENEDILDGWKATYPVYLYHSVADSFVPYFNAEDAAKSLGNQVELFSIPDVGVMEGHYAAMPFVLLKLLSL